MLYCFYFALVCNSPQCEVYTQSDRVRELSLFGNSPVINQERESARLQRSVSPPHLHHCESTFHFLDSRVEFF